VSRNFFGLRRDLPLLTAVLAHDQNGQVLDQCRTLAF
jgi:hypothetical protein